MRAFSFLLALVAAFVLAAFADGALSSDQITSLPGYNATLPFNHYAGYLTVDSTRGRNLFYWYTEAQVANPSSAPLILWLNGGAALPSLAFSPLPAFASPFAFTLIFTPRMSQENGPFLVQSDGYTIELNEHSWNKVANVFWLESPAGVGFSYSDTKADYNTDDTKTAQDAYAAVQLFLARYPALRSNKFFITGESYAGHYIPQLTQQIIHHNAVGDQPFINIAGIAVGNGLTNEPDDFAAPLPFFRYHAMVSPTAYESANTICKGDFTSTTPGCQNAVNKALAPISNLIDQYDIIEDVCLDDTPENRLKLVKTRRPRQSTILLKNHPNLGEMPITPPCVDNYVTAYLNRADVKAAIHAKSSISWDECTDGINYTFNHSSILPVYEQFFAYKNLTILIYSGDVDGVLPFIGTQGWLARLPITVTEDWREWIGSDKQSAGYVVKYDKLTFLTIRGAGHMVPEFRPLHALDFLTKFINGQPY